MTNELLLVGITVDPNIGHGKPCIRGLRFSVEFLLERLSADMSWDQILADYPDLDSDDLRATCAVGGASQSRQKYRTGCCMKLLVDAQLPLPLFHGL